MGIPVKELLDGKHAQKFCLELVTGAEGLEREVTTSRIQKPGLQLTGLLDELHPDRLQIFGAAEIGYLNSLTDRNRERVVGAITKPGIPAVVVTKGLETPELLFKICEKESIPLLKTSLTSSIFIEAVTRFLDERLAPTTTLHGVLVDVLGMGILITGSSGIGKSECALDLVTSGHRLVSDDVVIVKRLPRSVLSGTSSDLIRYHMEIRGIGIVNIRDLFGITAIREHKQLDLVVELVKWDAEGEYERLGFEDKRVDILGVELPHLMIPVSPGRSVASLVEVAARNQILKIMGHHSAQKLERELMGVLEGKKDKVSG